MSATPASGLVSLKPTQETKQLLSQCRPRQGLLTAGWEQRLTPGPKERLEGPSESWDRYPSPWIRVFSGHVWDITVSFASKLRHSFYGVLLNEDSDVVEEKENKTMLLFPVLMNLASARTGSLIPPGPQSQDKMCRPQNRTRSCISNAVYEQRDPVQGKLCLPSSLEFLISVLFTFLIKYWAIHSSNILKYTVCNA